MSSRSAECKRKFFFFFKWVRWFIFISFFSLKHQGTLLSTLVIAPWNDLFELTLFGKKRRNSHFKKLTLMLCCSSFLFQLVFYNLCFLARFFYFIWLPPAYPKQKPWPILFAWIIMPFFFHLFLFLVQYVFESKQARIQLI
jgi:hypothetical protein